MAFAPIDHPRSDQAAAGFRRFRSNTERLDRAWPGLLAEHLHEWAAVYDDGTLVVRPSIGAIRDAVPANERDTAVMRYIARNDTALIL